MHRLAVNFLLIESLQRFHQYYGEDFQVSIQQKYPSYLLKVIIGRVPNP